MLTLTLVGAEVALVADTLLALFLLWPVFNPEGGLELLTPPPPVAERDG